MTDTKRWLDELPLQSHERELLLVGKSARPAEGAIDTNWRALCTALGTTAGVAGAVSSGVAGNAISASASASGKVGSTLLASKAAGAGLSLVVAKSLAVGVAIGLAVMGVGVLAEHSSRTEERPAKSAKPSPASNARRPEVQSIPAWPAPQPGSAASATALVGPIASSSPARERLATNNPSPSQGGAPAAASVGAPAAPDDKTASLSQQARELAELKRLIDSGAPNEALRRLDQNFSADAASLLSEERDALYVQALARAQRRDEARSFARRFLARYPHSPYFETMSQLLSEK
jgi:hypothetical protein